LATALRDEGGFEYKKAITDALITFATEIPETREYGMFTFFFFFKKKERKKKEKQRDK